MTREEEYRQQAKILLRRIYRARELFKKHKPSIGYVGEESLRIAIKTIIPNGFCVCQGFVINKEITVKEEQLSRQCDIIIYRKNKDAVYYSCGDLCIINASSVVAVIEVKSSIIQRTFTTTFKAFEVLTRLGVPHKFVFIFGSITLKTLERWILNERLKKRPFSEILTYGTPLYDWSDIELLPKAILSLKSCKYFVLDHIQDDYDDRVGYASYMIKDKEKKEVSCLQEFFASLVDLIEYDTFTIDINEYSISEGFTLFRM
jgi:hypothetical protein